MRLLAAVCVMVLALTLGGCRTVISCNAPMISGIPPATGAAP